MLDRVNPIVKGIKKSGIRRFSEAAQTTPGVVSLTLGEPEFNTDELVKQAAFEALNQNKTHYPVGMGVKELRTAISSFESKNPLSTYRADEVFVTVGSTQALAACFISLLEEGDEVIIPEPMYISYRPMIEVCKAKVIPLDTTQFNFQIDPQALNALVTDKTKLIVITSPNNPTGVVFSKESLDAVVEVALKHRLFVISDDVYSQLVYLDHCPSLRDYPALRPQLIIAQSFSKPYAMTGWRIGYVMADQPIVNVIGTFHAYLVSGIAPFIQAAAIEALKQDTSWMKENYRMRRDRSLAMLDEMKVSYIKPEGAFYIFVDVREFNLSSEDFCVKALEAYKVAMVPGVYFGASCDGFIRISYAVSEKDLYEGLSRFSSMVTDLRSA